MCDFARGIPKFPPPGEISMWKPSMLAGTSASRGGIYRLGVDVSHSGEFSPKSTTLATDNIIIICYTVRKICRDRRNYYFQMKLNITANRTLNGASSALGSYIIVFLNNILI